MMTNEKKITASLILIFLFLAMNTSALNDVALTIINADTQLCLSDGSDLTNQVCNATTNLTLDGAQDHIVYFSYEEPFEANASIINKGVWMANNFLGYSKALIPFIFFAVCMFGGVMLVLRILNMI